MEAIIFIGIQASGKSTFYKERFFKTHIRINLDMLRNRVREDIFLDTCIDTRQPFVVDNTNPTIEDRKKYIDKSKKKGFKVIGYYFQSTTSEAMLRNKNRPGKEAIPAPGIYGTFNKLQQPSLEEGFDELYYVKIGESNNFIVEKQSN
jgi:predicted kinase